MNRRWALAVGVAAIVTVGAGSTAGAAPKDKAETYICNGQPTTFIVGGRSGFLNGIHYLAHNVVVSGSFDPTDPTLPTQTFSDTQWTSGQTGGLQCSLTETTTTPEGVETFSIRFNAIPTK